jgi:hypothetical protein
MRTPLLGAAAAISLLGASLSFGAAEAAQPALLTSGVYQASDAPTLQPAQFFFGGQNYCWYGGGWQGPGYYYCGYAWRRGLGWGGGAGWNGWHGGGNAGGNRGGARSNFSGAGARGVGGHDSAARASGGHAGAGRASGGHASGGHAGAGHAGGDKHR